MVSFNKVKETIEKKEKTKKINAQNILNRIKFSKFKSPQKVKYTGVDKRPIQSGKTKIDILSAHDSFFHK